MNSVSGQAAIHNCPQKFLWRNIVGFLNNEKTRKALGKAHVSPTKLFRRLAVTKNHCKTTRRCRWDVPDVIKFRVAAHSISEKAIRFRHPDYNPDRAQKLISLSMSRHLRTRNISSKSMHAFWVILLTDRQTDRQTNAGKRIYLLLCQR